MVLQETIRTCIACGAKLPKPGMIRYILGPEGVVHDPGGGKPGRGAYTCPETRCIERGLTPRTMSRAFRRRIGPEDLAGIRAAMTRKNEE